MKRLKFQDSSDTACLNNKMSTFLDPITISFYISFLGIISLFGLKIFEIKSGKKNWVSKIAGKTDSTIRNSYIFLRKTFSHINKKNAIALIQWIAYYILSWARRAYIWAHRKAHAHPPSKMVIDMVRGRGEIKRNGGVSFFLKSISSDDIVEEAKK